MVCNVQCQASQYDGMTVFTVDSSALIDLVLANSLPAQDRGSMKKGQETEGLQFFLCVMRLEKHSNIELETDTEILLEKADMALKKYKMHAVVANELSTRKEVVIVVTNKGKISVHRDKNQIDAVVECPLINLLSDMHSDYIQDMTTK